MELPLILSNFHLYEGRRTSTANVTTKLSADKKIHFGDAPSIIAVLICTMTQNMHIIMAIRQSLVSLARLLAPEGCGHARLLGP